MYTDKITPSMESAIDKTNVAARIQVAYDAGTASTPQPLAKKIADITEMLAREDETTQELLQTWADVGQKDAPGESRPSRRPRRSPSSTPTCRTPPGSPRPTWPS